MFAGETAEQTLLNCCAAGDRRAFNVLWDRYRDRIYRFVSYHVEDFDEAEDLTQEVLLRTWTALARGTQIAAFVPYLYEVAKNVVRDWARSPKSRGKVAELVDDDQGAAAVTPSPAEAVEAKLSHEFLVQELDEILLAGAQTPEERAWGQLRKLAFVLFYVDRLTVPEIGVELRSLAEALVPAAPPPARRIRQHHVAAAHQPTEQLAQPR